MLLQSSDNAIDLIAVHVDVLSIVKANYQSDMAVARLEVAHLVHIHDNAIGQFQEVHCVSFRSHCVSLVRSVGLNATRTN